MSYTAEYAEGEPARNEIDAIPGLLVVEFGAPWCGYCIGAQPALKQLLEQHPDVQHIKVHDGRGQPLGRSFRVKLWPSLVFMRDGEVLQQLARPTERQIEEGLRELVAGGPV